MEVRSRLPSPFRYCTAQMQHRFTRVNLRMKKTSKVVFDFDRREYRLEFRRTQQLSDGHYDDGTQLRNRSISPRSDNIRTFTRRFRRFT